MPRLPDYTSLGSTQLKSRSVVPLQLGRAEAAQADAARAEGQAAQAIGNIGDAVARIGERIQERRDKLTYVKEKSKFLQALTLAESEIGEGDDTEYETYGNRYIDRVNEAKKESIGQIKNPDMRGQFEADADLDITQGLTRMAAKSWAMEVNHGVKDVQSTIKDSRDLYLSSSDSVRESVLNNVNKSIDIAAENGYLKPAQAEALKRSTARNYAEGWISLQPAQEQARLLKSGEGVAELFDADERKAMIEKIDTRGASQAAADEIWSSGKSDKDMLKASEQISDPKLRDETKSRIKTRINEREAVKTQAENDAFNDGMALVVENNSLDAVPVGTWKTMNGTQQARLRDYVEARADKLVNGRKTDDYEVLDEIDNMIRTGELNETSQLAPYEPFLRNATIRAKRKEILKRDVVKSSDMQKAFELRSNKTKAKWSNNQRKEFIAFQEFVLDRVKETGRPEDVDHLADTWFMEGYSKDASIWTDDPDTFGQGVMKGKEFIIKTPETEQESVGQTLTILQGIEGFEVPKGGLDEFYTNTYNDGQRYLEVNDYPVTPRSMAAYSLLKASGSKVSVDRIRALEGEL